MIPSLDNPRLPGCVVLASVCLASSLSATPPPPDPEWWSDSSAPVINSNTPNNYGPANIGQAKWMAKCAIAALAKVDPDLAKAIDADLTGEGDALPADWTAPNDETQRSALLIGQLKALAAPFYEHLNLAAPIWIEQQMILNGTAQVGTHFPWTPTTGDDENKAVATIGQLKAVFALRFENDADEDDLKDIWEQKFAQELLASGRPTSYWGSRYADLQAGDVDPDVDYTAEGITAGELAQAWNLDDAEFKIEIESRQIKCEYLKYNTASAPDVETYGYMTSWNVVTPNSAPNVSPWEFTMASRGIEGAPWIRQGGFPNNLMPFHYSAFMNIAGAHYWEDSVTSPGTVTKGGGKIETKFRLTRKNASQPFRMGTIAIRSERTLFQLDSEATKTASKSVQIEIPAGNLRSDWYTIAVDAADGKFRGIDLIPLEIVKPAVDSNGRKAKGYVPAATLAVAKMERSLDSSANLAIGEDPDHFIIRMPGGSWTTKPVSIKVATKNSEDDIFDYETSLNLDPAGSYRETKSLILVSDDEDDIHERTDIGEEDEPGDRSHKITLEGSLEITELKIGDEEIPCDYSVEVPKLKTVTINIIRMNDCGMSQQDVINDVRRANERLAQTGIKLVVAYNVEMSCAGAGIADSNLQVWDGAKAEPSEDVKKMIDTYGTPTNTDIHVFYCAKNFLNAAPLRGYSYPQFLNPSPRYQNNFLVSSDTGLYTLVHELGHLLTNAGHHADPHNVMKEAAIYDGVGGAKRFYHAQSVKMRNHPLAQ